MTIFRVFGAGEWGLAIANDLSISNNIIEVYIRDKKKLEAYKTDSYYKDLGLTFNNNISFHNIDNTDNLESTHDVVNIIATSSSGFSSIIEDNINYFRGCSSLTWITKGLDHTSGLLFHQLIDQKISDKIQKCIISGPSFAKDLVNKKSLEVSIASTDNNLSNELISKMTKDYFVLLPTKDIIGIEISSVLKNISAILAGCLTANQYPDEYIDQLITLSQSEVKRMTKLIASREKNYLVPDTEIDKTLVSPGCIGDLRLTCFYNISRNRQLGLKLTKDSNIKKLISSIGTVEGYLSTATLFNNKEVYGDGLIVNVANDILYNHKEPKIVLDQLFN